MTKFLWLKTDGPASGFRQLTPLGMCLSAFAFIMREQAREKILLGKYRNVPEWERLTGLDEERRKRHSTRLSIPASHLKYGEDPRDTARRVVEEIIRFPSGKYLISQPWVETERWGLDPDLDKDHWDVSFYFNVVPDKDDHLKKPKWYEILDFYDPFELSTSSYARKHEDVIARWRNVRNMIR